MIHVIATITLQSPDLRAGFLELFNANVPAVLAEDGCVSYQPVTDIDAGIDGVPACREDTVVVIEHWQSVTRLEAHLAAPHMLRFL